MTDAELAFKAGTLFNQKITSPFWDSFKSECGRVQAEVLVYLFDHGKVLSSDIVNDMNITKQHVSKIIKNYIENGYVKMEINEKDRRSSRILLTEKGTSYIKSHIDISNHSFDSLLLQMEEDERQNMMGAMKTISDLLSKYPR